MLQRRAVTSKSNILLYSFDDLFFLPYSSALNEWFNESRNHDSISTTQFIGAFRAQGSCPISAAGHQITTRKEDSRLLRCWRLHELVWSTHIKYNIYINILIYILVFKCFTFYKLNYSSFSLGTWRYTSTDKNRNQRRTIRTSTQREGWTSGL